MALFKHKDGGVCEVLTKENIAKLRKNTNYKEITNKSKEKETKNKEEQLNQEQSNKNDK